ncbi:hypothetical protein ABZT47_23020 [Sphaerisporangium sp. NPDC005289]|uniref:hypothetical protein n=1 Tax=Sphaerisporangium sp. NPDC005289 TaxID=3155247 RepID=UPI0033AC3C2D
MNALPHVLGVAAVATVLLASGCGSDSATTGAQPAPGRTGGAPAAFVECMRKNGVNMPTGRPGGAPTAQPGGSPSARPSGGPRGFGTMSPQIRKAFEACRSLMPQGRAGQGGRRGGFDPSALAAFRSCMKDNGADLPAGGGVRRFDTKDPAIAKALEKCRPLLPTPAATPTAG